jgi:AraC-like DNA-binding protein
MNTKLNHDQNWMDLSKQANWSVERLAQLSGVSRRTLHRYFLKHMGQTPKDWLTGQRQKRALELLRDGSSVKETAAHLGYGCSETFSRDFKKWHGHCPVQTSNVPKSHAMSHFNRTFPLKSGKAMI